jgi:flagellar basal body rod protein FlgG
MLKAFSTAATGMEAQQTMIDAIANNLANVNTNGFKRSGNRQRRSCRIDIAEFYRWRRAKHRQ